MASKQWGDPVLTLRLPAWQISGLKKIASEHQTSVSALIRDQIDALLYVNNITAEAERPLDGQIRTSDLGA